MTSSESTKATTDKKIRERLVVLVLLTAKETYVATEPTFREPGVNGDAEVGIMANDNWFVTNNFTENANGIMPPRVYTGFPIDIRCVKGGGKKHAIGTANANDDATWVTIYDGNVVTINV